MNQLIADLNKNIVDECIGYLTALAEASGIADDSDVIRMVANIVECTGGSIDACSHCGAMPMNTNCNNSRCQDL